jgi:hypothetical protein
MEMMPEEGDIPTFFFRSEVNHEKPVRIAVPLHDSNQILPESQSYTLDTGCENLRIRTMA